MPIPREGGGGGGGGRRGGGGGGGELEGYFGTGVRPSFLKPTQSYTWSSKKMAYSYT